MGAFFSKVLYGCEMGWRVYESGFRKNRSGDNSSFGEKIFEISMVHLRAYCEWDISGWVLWEHVTT